MSGLPPSTNVFGDGRNVGRIGGWSYGQRELAFVIGDNRLAQMESRRAD